MCGLDTGEIAVEVGRGRETEKAPDGRFMGTGPGVGGRVAQGKTIQRWAGF